MKFLLAVLFFIPVMATAQSNKSFMYESGRIYVVITVMLIILLGLILYLVRFEKKIKKLEEEAKKV